MTKAARDRLLAAVGELERTGDLVRLAAVRDELRHRANRHRAERRTRRWSTPGAFAVDLDPSTVQTPALELIDTALVEISERRLERLMISIGPQEGKSERVSNRFPLWVLLGHPDTRIVIASYEHGLARRWGRAIRTTIAEHPGLGLTVRHDSSAADDWQLDGHRGGIYCAGIGGALTGRPADLLIIDDPVKNREQADSLTFRERAWDWWQNVARTRLAPGAAVVLIMTRWHEDDLAGRLLCDEGGDEWRVINIPAQADHDPTRMESDPLGRKPGEWLLSARGRTREQWEKIRRDVGAQAFTALYQGKPSPPEGELFKRHWWREYNSPRWIVRADGAHWVIGADEVCQSWDMAFKDLEGSDYVVGQVWARYGLHVYLVDQIRERLSFVETRKAVRRLSAKWPQAMAKYVEDKANGTAVINSLHRTVAGLIPVEPEGGKQARASAVAPFAEAGQIWLPSPEVAAWVGEFVEEHAGFPNATHDDQVDAMSQAVNRMLLAPLLDGTLVVEDSDLDDEIGGYDISPV